MEDVVLDDDGDDGLVWWLLLWEEFSLDVVFREEWEVLDLVELQEACG